MMIGEAIELQLVRRLLLRLLLGSLLAVVLVLAITKMVGAATDMKQGTVNGKTWYGTTAVTIQAAPNGYDYPGQATSFSSSVIHYLNVAGSGEDWCWLTHDTDWVDADDVWDSTSVNVSGVGWIFAGCPYYWIVATNGYHQAVEDPDEEHFDTNASITTYV